MGRKRTSTNKKNNINNRFHGFINSVKTNNQVISILIFGLSMFLFCVVLIKGENIWTLLHNFTLGLFGWASILWPALFMYIAIVTALDNSKDGAGLKILFSSVAIFIFCTAVYIFSYGNINQNQGYIKKLIELYHNGVNSKGAGLFSGILGIPFIALFGDAGAKIIISLLVFISIMLLTGLTLIQLFNAIKLPFAFLIRKIKEKKGDRKNKKNQNEKDLPRDELGLPIHPVKSPLPSEQGNKKRIKAKAKDNYNDCYDGSAELAARAFLEKDKRESKKEKFCEEEVKMQPDRSENSTYNYPKAEILDESSVQNRKDIANELQTNGQMLVDTLKSFSVQTKIVDISRGPAVTRYELQPAAGVKISKITNLADDIALNLAASGVRIEAPIPGKSAVGIEIPNKIISIVKMRELINSPEFRSSTSKLTVILGKDIAGNVTIADLAKMPHLLIAGSTGSGKSVCINSFIISLLYKATPDEVRLLMIDPKVVELGIYNGIPHLLVPVVTDPKKAAGALNWAVTEMLKRYNIFAQNNVRDLTSYNNMVKKKLKEGKFNKDEEKPEPMPQIVIIIDELADLMMAAPNEVEDAICRLAQMARAAGMHLVIATQRPSVDVITGIIKANIPSRIALAVSSQIDSRTILDSSGAEKLLGRGDMLFSPVGSAKPIRVQGCYVTDREIEAVIDFIKNTGEMEYDQKVIEEIEKNAISEPTNDKRTKSECDDPMLSEAIKCVIDAGQASTSMLQRRLRLGYARAGRLIDEMEKMGVIGASDGSKPRQVLITHQQFINSDIK